MSDPYAEVERLALAEAYYLVARDLQMHANEFARVAESLNRRADMYCEQNAAATAPPAPGSTPESPEV
jgi:hypothetical protein